MAVPVEWSGAIFVSGHVRQNDANFDPRVTGLANGNVLVTWWNLDIGTGNGEHPAGDGDFGASTLYYALYDPEGRPLLTRVSLTADYGGFYPDAHLRSYDVAATSDGGFVVAWVIDVDAFDSSRVFWTRRNYAGAVEEDTVPTSDSTDNPYRAISLVNDLRDDLTTLAVSHSESGFFGNDVDRYGINVSSDGGWGMGFAMADNNADAMTLLGGEIALLGNGNVVSVYGEADDDVEGIEGWITTRSGTRVNNFEVGYAGSNPQAATLAGGGFVVAWQLPRGGAFNNEVVLRLYDDDGNLTRSSSVFVERDVNLAGYSTAGTTSDLDVVALPQGGFYVVWIRNGTPWGRLYSAAGDAQGDPQVLGQEALSLDAGVTSDGRILVTYADRYQSVITDILDPRSSQLYVGGSGTGFVPPGATLFGTGDGNFAAPTVLTGRPTDSRLFGDDGVNTLLGQAGNDVLDGGRGRDIVRGGGGNDIFIIRNGEGLDAVDGGTGTDLLDLSGIDASGQGVFINMPLAVFTGSGSDGSIRNVENVSGTQRGDTIYGNALANVIRGNGGNDVLEGGGGRDTVDGGPGDDSIRIRDGQGIDNVEGGEGHDTLLLFDIVSGGGVTIDLELGRFSKKDLGRDLLPRPVTVTTAIAGIEDIYGTQLNDTLRGDGGVNVFYGQSGRDRLEGRGGADRLLGEDDDDTLVGGADGDTLDGGAGIDTASYEGSRAAVQVNLGSGRATGGDATGDRLLSIENLRGGEGADQLIGDTGANRLEGMGGDDVLGGGEGSDTLNGGTGADYMSGGSGDDQYLVDHADDMVVEATNDGLDVVFASTDYRLRANQEIEFLRANAGVTGLSLTGNNLVNAVVGGGGGDLLRGGGGADLLQGGLGDDTYFVDNGGVTIIEEANGGTDTVRASVTTTLSANVERLFLTGSAALNGTGNGGSNALFGNAGDNALDGAGGADILKGAGGNDRYYVDSTRDLVQEATGAGRDVVYASVSYTLRAGQEIEVLRADAGGTGLKLTGNEFANTLIGGAGADTLAGGLGADRLSGGTGADMFVFRTLADSGRGAERDIITDFVEGTDRINLSLIDANTTAGANGDQAFSFIGTGAFTMQARQLHQVSANGNTIVEGDVDGNGVADFQIQLRGLHTLHEADFVL